MNNIFVSLILPIRNESRYIRRNLQAVLTQDYSPEKMEVIVADGMSDDGTQTIVQELAAKHPNHLIQIVDNVHINFSAGFNIALKGSRGDVIIMLGGHTVIAPDYISRCVHHLRDPAVECVGGVIETVAESFVGQVIALAMSSNFGVGGVAFRTATDPQLIEVDTVAFGAYKRNIFEQCGFLDEEMVRNQDDEFNYRLRRNGGRIFLAPDLRLKYHSRASLLALWRQYFQYGFWKVRVLQKHPRQMRLRQFIPPAFVFAVLASLITIFIFPWGISLFGFITGSYILGNLTASIWIAARRGWLKMSLFPLVFSILHLSYGFGFLAGLLKFIDRWGDRIGNIPLLESTNDS